MTTWDFSGVLSPATCLGIAAVLAAACWWVYFTQLRDVSASLRWVLPTLRAIAIVMCLLMLAGPVVRHREWNGKPNQVTILLDATQSMQWHDGDAKSREGYLSRLQRAVRLLLTDEPRLLPMLSQRSEISVSRFGGSTRVPLWSSTRAESEPLPTDERAWLPEKWGTSTALGDVLSESVRFADQAATPNERSTPDSVGNQTGSDCVVLLTDGRNTAGPAPLEAARQLAARKRKLFIVGYGNTEEPYDLAMLSVRTPDRVLKTDMLRGELTWKDQFPAGHRVLLQIHAGDTLVWEQTVTSERRQRRSLTFAIPVRDIPLTSQAPARGTEVREQTVTLRASVESVGSPSSSSGATDALLAPTEAQSDNNAHAVHLRIVDREYRILILDNRPRWETRYLRNALERDPNWRVDAFVIDAEAGMRPFAESTSETALPQSFEGLTQYDLIVMGELPFGAVNAEWMQSVQRYVGDSGGGLIVLDGPHGLLRDAAWRDLHALLPIQWTSTESGQRAQPTPVRLAPAGETLEALHLDVGTAAEQVALWPQLPGIQFVAPVKALPGAETLIELSIDKAAPVLVTRRYGAGRVLYLATDQTWRWRYGVADRYHQRWWNQLTRWAMRMPFAVQNEYLQLTTDHSQYAPGDAILVTARLRDQQGRGVASDDVQVHCRNPLDDSISTRTVSMQPDAAITGLYRAQIASLPAGEYTISVTAAGIPDPSLDLSCTFAVTAPGQVELQELSCHESLLRELAETTGGVYLPEASSDRLAALLAALSQAEAIETRTALAESYWWFVPLMFVLALEWWLRKRAGLI